MTRTRNDAYLAALDLEGDRILAALADAAQATPSDLAASGVLVRTPDAVTQVSADGTVTVTAVAVEIVHVFLLPALDPRRLGALLEMRVTECTDILVRLEI